jgi:hypothetical protein
MDLRVNAGPAAKERLVDNSLADAANAAPACDRRSTRRSFTDAEKLAIVMGGRTARVSVAAICRRHNSAPSMIFRWRARFSVARASTRTCQWCDSPI